MSYASKEYVLVSGDAGAARLALLHETYGASTEALLRELGLGAGMRAVDLGCGTGTVSRWMAAQVGVTGQVIGMDISAAQLGVARREAQRRGLTQLRFDEGSCYATGLPRAGFDLVYCRFLLCHVSDPEGAVREMRDLLKPDGILVCEDVDVASLYSDPPNAGLHRMRDVMLELGRTRGVDYCLGPRLHRIFRAAGFDAPSVRIDQPVHASSDAKRFWELTFLEAAPAMVEAGLANTVDVEEMAREMAVVAHDDSVFVAQARKIQVWARR
jgi:SAM-dependent methyltransferase